MKFDYIELLTIRQALLFTQKEQKQLDLGCVIHKVEAAMGEQNKNCKPDKT